MPVVSVVMPAFNSGKWIAAALESVQGQSLADWECVVVDDASQDESGSIAEALGDTRIRVIRHETNLGVAAALNTGIRNALGRYVQLLAADDLIEDEKFEWQARFLDENPEVGVVYGEAQYFDDGAVRKLRKGFSSNSDWMPKLSGGRDVMFPAFLRDNILPIPTALVRRAVFESVGLHDETLASHEDYDLCLRWAEAGVRFAYEDTPNTTVLIRCHPESLSRNRVRMLETKLEVWRRIVPTLDRRMRKIVRAARARTYMLLAREEIARSRRRQASLWLAKAAFLHPGVRARAKLSARALAAAMNRWPRQP